MIFKLLTACRGEKRWRKMIGTSLVILLLSAVPAFAIVFGRLKVVSNRATGGAPRAIVTDIEDGGFSVDVGVNSSSRVSTSIVVVRRSFRVERVAGSGRNLGERVQFARSYVTEANGLTVRVTSIVVPGGSRVANVRRTVGSTQFIGEDRAPNRFLRAGNYTLLTTITYIQRRGGFWDNSVSGSPHTFTISSI